MGVAADNQDFLYLGGHGEETPSSAYTFGVCTCHGKKSFVMSVFRNLARDKKIQAPSKDNGDYICCERVGAWAPVGDGLNT